MRWILSVCILISVACKSDQSTYSLPTDKITDIIVDLHIAEEMVNKFKIADRDSVRNLYLQDIAQIHKTDTASITRNIHQLQQDPDNLLIIYEDVYKKLKNMGVSHDNSN